MSAIHRAGKEERAGGHARDFQSEFKAFPYQAGAGGSSEMCQERVEAYRANCGPCAVLGVHSAHVHILDSFTCRNTDPEESKCD